MPYEVRLANGAFCVYKQGTSERMGCHSTREKANRQLAALYANEPGKAAWSTAYVNDLPDSAFACTRGDQRFYPHHDASGALDLPHLRAALSRIGDSSNEQCGKGHLEAHAAAQQVGDRGGKALVPMKATILDDDAFRLLAFPFGGPLPSSVFPRGVDLDFQTFTERTDIKPDWFDVRLVDWHHGQDETLRRTVLGKAGDIGGFDGPSSEPDEDGWWVTVWLKAGEQRVKLVKRLAEQATIYGSSETAPGLAAIKADGVEVPWRRSIPGEITRWPYVRQTLSTSPQNTYSIIRPLKATLDDLVSEGELPAAAFWSDIEAAMRDLGADLRLTSPWGESVAKAGRVLSSANEADIKQALEAARAALERLETVVRRQPDYSVIGVEPHG